MASRPFLRLREFIRRKMRMSHVYQPLVVIELLDRGGRATTRELASRLLSADEGQLDYYEHVFRNMPARVLRSHGVIEQTDDGWELVGWEGMSPAERRELRMVCEERLEAFLEARGRELWDARRRNLRNVPGMLRYEVLARARRRCELCGASADIRGLHVDHIVPRSLGGSNDLANLQALCFVCNDNKGNRDDRDFRGLLDELGARKAGCVFCEPTTEILAESTLALALRDRYPVTPQHVLVVPRRHVSSWGSLQTAEVLAIELLTREVRTRIVNDDPTVEGFNIGANDGVAAGQTIDHAHLHVIPRRPGDVPDATGGVRGVIPERRRY